MDFYLFQIINNLAGKNIWLDTFMIFCAEYLIFGLFLILIFLFFAPLENLSINDKDKKYNSIPPKKDWTKVSSFLMGFSPLEKRKKIQLIILAFSSTVLAWLLNHLISLMYFRPRPFVSHNNIFLLIQHNQDKSFPSDHTTIAFALGLSIYLFNKKLGILALICAFFIAFARIFSGLHYPLDILGGIIVAFLIIRTYAV
ncbi:phosphatase PAP2 family protein [Candidatus Kuenenbacteria bacterium]|nr:phosphatase PAP2 family protein [Candidatus Kuenenbacteria bacterium]